jgi:hypothetical protein
MLDAVRARSRRLQMRHRTGIAGVAVVVAVAAAVGTPYVLASIRHTGHAPVTPGKQNHAVAIPSMTGGSQSTAPSHPTRVPLGPATFAPVTFPMDPTFVPAGLPAPTEGMTVGTVRLVYTGTGNKFLTASVSTDKPTVDSSAATHKSTTVNGHPATIYTGSIDGAPGVLIVWQLHGKWVSVQGGGLTSAQVRQFAVGLADRAHTPGPLPFTVALAPHGYVVSFQEIHPEESPTGFVFMLSAPNKLSDQSSNDQVGISNDGDIASEATGTPITVNGYPAKIDHDADGQVKVFVLRPGFTYMAHEPENGPLSDADLIRFAAGIAPRS